MYRELPDGDYEYVGAMRERIPHPRPNDPLLYESGNTTALMRHLDDLLRDCRRRSEQDFIRHARALAVLEAAYFEPNRYRLMMVLGADLSATAARLDRSLLWTCRDCGQTSSEDDQRGGVHLCPVPLSLSWWQRFWLALTGRTP
ncbi:MAG: hypothetical protein ACE5FA_06605 [Dehalococcoidia bacterium]